MFHFLTAIRDWLDKWQKLISSILTSIASLAASVTIVLGAVTVTDKVTDHRELEREFLENDNLISLALELGDTNKQEVAAAALGYAGIAALPILISFLSDTTHSLSTYKVAGSSIEAIMNKESEPPDSTGSKSLVTMLLSVKAGQLAGNEPSQTDDTAFFLIRAADPLIQAIPGNLNPGRDMEFGDKSTEHQEMTRQQIRALHRIQQELGGQKTCDKPDRKEDCDRRNDTLSRITKVLQDAATDFPKVYEESLQQ